MTNKPQARLNDPPRQGQRGRPPAAQSARCRSRILEATTAVFLEMGYERGSTNEIARRARTSKQTLYGLYPSKADLFVAVMQAHTEKLYSQHEYFIATDQSPREVLQEMGQRALALFRAPDFLALIRVASTVAKKFPVLAENVWQQCVERGYELLAQYLESKHLGGPNYRDAAEKFSAMVLRDLVIRALLNPPIQFSEPQAQTRVQEAVDDFFLLYPPPQK